MTIDNTLLKGLTLKQYFNAFAQYAETTHSIANYLELLGEGKSNEGTPEHSAIKRFYITPVDSRFNVIYLNHSDVNEVDSIVWFFKPNYFLTLSELKELFGDFSTHNIIYDETSSFNFGAIDYKGLTVQVSNDYWLTEREGRLYSEEVDGDVEVTDDFHFHSLYLSFH